MRARIVKMRFLTPLHLGNREGALEGTMDHIPSDVIFSALCNACRTLYGSNALESLFLKPRAGGLIKLSSAFPYLKELYFLPRPVNLDLSFFGFENKRAKRVKYIDHSLFCEYVSGSLKAGSFSGYYEEPVQGALLPAKYRQDWICRAVEVPRVALDSVTQESNIFYFKQLYFNRDAGLYCLVKCGDESWKKVMACFRLLGDEGVGGDRSCGKGGFFVEFPGEMVFPDIERPAGYVTLSLYYPLREEVRDIDAEYVLIKRAGYVFSPDENAVRKRSVTMMAEGSVIYSPLPPDGAIVDITPPGFFKHRVWRYGRAFGQALAHGKGGGQSGWQAGL